MNYVYILECGDGSFYTGWTNDIKHRIQMHQEGKGAKYTKAHLPVKLVYFEEFEDKSEAMRREYEIKQLSRSEKMMIVSANRLKSIE
ncbi:GIY-YIG nuclease family protein [Anaerorhabdus sp.]|uniref:GIY-YIG nuclease family protein n=1 Tax=Anaerorhabdus sp. TaxID=1872524 RepID=UPI002FC6EF77